MTRPEDTITSSFESRRLHELSSSERRLRENLETISLHLAENEQLFSRLFALEMQLLRATDPEDVCIALLRGLRGEFELDMVRLWFDRDTFISQHPFHRLAEADLVWLEKGEIADSGLAGQPVRLVQMSSKERFIWLTRKDDRLQSMALMLLGPAAQPFGVLGLGSLDGERFTPQQDTAFLRHLAQIITLMLENTVSRERLSRMMVKDSASGAHNQRFFQPYSHQRLSQWFGRHMPVACIALHLSLPEAESLAATLVEHITPLLRHQDILVRQQQAQFILFLPGLRPMQDVDMAEAIMDACVTLPVSGMAQHVTLGVALSSHDEDPSITELLQRAEQARQGIAGQSGAGIAYAKATTTR